jgi:hypothetical protein
MSSWWNFLDFYEGLFVWPLALAAIVLFALVKSVRWHVTAAALLVLVFLPHIHKAVGGMYFDYLCRTQAGEFIYRTVDNVEGILQMRPRDGSKDYFDRMRAGDIPEDPWGHTNSEAQRPGPLYVGAPGSGKYVFLERNLVGDARKIEKPDKPIRRESLEVVASDEQEKAIRVRTVISYSERPRSKFGYTWSEETGKFERILNIHGGVLRIVEVDSGALLASKQGFLRLRPWEICPIGKDEDSTFRFVSRVLRPIQH